MPPILRTVVRVLLVITLVMVTILSLLPGPPAASGNLDKVTHALAYLVVAFMLVLSTPERPMTALRVIGLILAAAAYGLLIEFVQRYVGREFDPLDMVANAVGAFAGGAAGALVRRLVSSRYHGERS
ncbi:MAG: VanZ family protein [Spirochaetota bacterium]